MRSPLRAHSQKALWMTVYHCAVFVFTMNVRKTQPLGSNASRPTGDRAYVAPRVAFSDIGNTLQNQTSRITGKATVQAPAATNNTQRPSANARPLQPVAQNQLRPTVPMATKPQSTVHLSHSTVPAPVHHSYAPTPVINMIDSLSESLEECRVEDIDEADWNNPQECAEYVNEIYAYLRTLEPKYQVDPNYMSRQTDITDKMRAILVDWYVNRMCSSNVTTGSPIGL